ncbi:MAG: class I SAM-dependent methyltransferase [Candidatus Saccharimonadales bacterium]
MKTKTANPELWLIEYQKKGIPSSFRDDASGSVKFFSDFLKSKNIFSGRALDIGCGTGRNSRYLVKAGFEVTCIDYLKEVIEKILEENKLEGQKKLTAVVHDIALPWPLMDNQFDIAIDTFCYKHQIPENSKNMYRSELARVLRKGAKFLITMAGVDDGYYSEFLSTSPEKERNVIIDPENNIASILYTKQDIIQEFEENFQLVLYEHKQKNSKMHNKNYYRSTHIFIFKRR